MPTSPLRTKLFIPPVPLELVSRPRLIERIDAGIHRKLSLISAPAGFGKTTLLSEWAHQSTVVNPNSHSSVAWVSLDKNDNDLSRFWAHFIAALQTIHLNMDRSVSAMVKSPQKLPAESFLTYLINEMTEKPDRFVLILDDYHLIENETIHHDMTFLLEHLPPQMHLVIAGRVDPPLPTALLRGRGQLNEFTATDLRFTYNETEAFFNDAMKLGVSKLGVKVLENRTEGWVASLQMAAISMRGHNDIQKFIYSFSGSQRYVLDYLTEEVFSQQPADVQSFLLETSILDRLTVSLCNAVTKRDDAMDKLDYLEAANLFLVPLDDERKWFRYHPLFADLLRSILKRSPPDLPQMLHHRASQWFEHEGLSAEAIDHALAAEDFEKAANLIESVAVPMITVESKVSTLLAWLIELPDELVATRPWLSISLASTRLAAGRLDDVEPLLRSAEEVLSAIPEEKTANTIADHSRINGALMILRAYTAWQQGNTLRTVELCHDALKHLPAHETFARAPIALILGVVHAMRGEMKTASQYLEEASNLGQASGNPYAALIAMGCLAEIQVKQGLLRQAAETNRRALRVGAEWSDGGDPLPATGYAHISLAQILYQWNKLDEAQQHIVKGIHLTEQCGNALIEQFFYPGIALMKEFRSTTYSEQEPTGPGQRISANMHNSLLSRLFDIWHARRSLAQGNLEAVERWAACHEIELNGNGLPDLWQEFSYLTLVRFYIAQGKTEEVDDLLQRMRQRSESEDRTGSVIEILVLQSIALKKEGKLNESLDTLNHALSLAQPEGYIRIFVDEGQAMEDLLHQAAYLGTNPDYTTTLLGCYRGSDLSNSNTPVAGTKLSTDTTKYDSPSSKASGTLSVRELEVLRLMASGASGKQVANELLISVGTAKKHIKNIYQKLDVHKQTTAVTRARELGLI